MSPTPPSSAERHTTSRFSRTCSLVGAVFLIISGLFPWFTAGAIASEPLDGRALLVTIIGVSLMVSGLLAVRAPHVWEAMCGIAALIGLILIALSTLGPPVELTASLGVGLCAIGSVLALVAVFSSRWRRSWSRPGRGEHPAGEDSDAAPRTDGENESPDGEPVEGNDLRSTGRAVARWVGVVVAVAVAYVVAWPAPTPSLQSRPAPTATYDEAIAHFESVSADEQSLNIFESCESQLLTHGERTDVAVVLFHGLTNCPKQFIEFGTELFEAGANVVILRAPEHGIATADGSSIGGVANVSDLTPEALRDYADRSVDIADGLGDEVRVLGLSMGGVIAAWTAQERADVTRVVAVAPAMTIPGVPASLTRVFRNIFSKIPNISLPSSGTPLDHAYAGETTKGLDATFGMGAYVARTGYESSPASEDVIVVLNPDDDQVDPVHLSRFASAWSSHGDAVSLYRLPAVGLPHDVIDVDQPDGEPEFVYPILVDLLDGEHP